MARHARRLINWIGGIALALALLLVLVVVSLAWIVDPNAWRPHIAKSASAILGREVQLGGDLHWHIGWNIAIASDGGSIANPAGFDAGRFAQWRHIRFGLDARALLGRRIVIDQIVIDGLQVHLQRNAAGEGNWNLTLHKAGPDAVGSAAAGKPALQAASIALRDSQLTFGDAQAAWQLRDLLLDVKLPRDLDAPARALHDVSLRGRLHGGPLPDTGVAIAFQAATMAHDAGAATLEVLAFNARWDDAQLSGAVSAGLGVQPAAKGRLALRVPSLRAQLANLHITPPPMADHQALGRLDVDGQFDMQGSTLAVSGLHVVLDDTRLDGTVDVERFKPLALRFDLAGDNIDFDRYLEPAEYKGKPFELPLAQLQALHVRGVLKMKSATVRGAKAKELRIDVQ